MSAIRLAPRRKTTNYLEHALAERKLALAALDTFYTGMIYLFTLIAKGPSKRS